MFIREYLRVFLPLAAMLVVYRAVAVPLIEPPIAAVTPIGPTVVLDQNAPWWNAYFQEGDWQLDQPMMAETAQGTVLLFGKLERLSPDRVQLAPLTILIPQKGETPAGATAGAKSTKQLAFGIKNQLGMEIQFRGAIDFLGGTLPPVKGGQMIGDIQIFAPPKEGDPNDGMLIETRELRIDRRRIWTTEAVKMKIGGSRIDGRDLSVYLDHDLLSSSDPNTDQSESPLTGLDRLELIYVDRVHIDLPDDGLFAERTPGRVPARPPRPAHAEVHCGGEFRFDFHQSLATLSSKVELRHQVEGLPHDIFQSDRLELHFRWAKSAKSASPSNAELSNNRLWSIDRLEAFGSSSSDPKDLTRWVRLEAPSMNARGQGRWLKVELDRGRISLANHLPGVLPNDSSQVYLQRDSMKVWSPEIEYESQRLVATNGSADKTTEQQRLGLLWASGPGQAEVVSDDGDQWGLSWAKLLQLQPDGDLDRLTIDGSANARSERQGRFSADTVDLWLSGLPQKLIDQIASQNSGYQASPIQPERMHAAGHVMVNTSQLRAQVADMQLWFSYPHIDAAKRQLLSLGPRPANELVDGNSPLVSPLGTAFSSLASIANTASQGTASQSKLLTAPARGPGKLTGSSIDLPAANSMIALNSTPPPQLPMTVTGETLVAKLSQTPQSMRIEDLALTGNVTVTRDQLSPTSPWPLTITGCSQLRMDSSDEGRLDATIIGSPANFSIGSGAIESNEIRFNERRQMVWIDQAGSFRIPPEAMQSMASNTVEAAHDPSSSHMMTAPGLIPSRGDSETSIDWIEAPEIRWQGRMVFDGRVARMDGGVKLNCRMQTDPETVWHIEGKASEMLVELLEPIVIGGNTNSQSKVANVRLRDAVDIKAAQTDTQGNRRSLEHLEVPELVFLVPQQQWLGTGPGSLRSRRIGNANPGSPKFINSGIQTELPSSLVRNPQAELQCLHLRFLGRMEGDMTQQLVSFHDRVEALIEPILSWDQAPDVQLVDRLKMGQTTLMSDQLSVYNTANLSWNQTQIANQQLRRDAAWEVTAAGHVIVESVNEQGTFSARNIARAQYVAIHNMLRIEGAPREPALLLQTPANHPSGEPPIRSQISSGAVNIKTGELDFQVSSVQVDLSGLSRPPNLPATGVPLANPNVPPNAFPANPPAQPSIQSPRDSYPLRRN